MPDFRKIEMASITHAHLRSSGPLPQYTSEDVAMGLCLNATKTDTFVYLGTLKWKTKKIINSAINLMERRTPVVKHCFSTASRTKEWIAFETQSPVDSDEDEDTVEEIREDDNRREQIVLNYFNKLMLEVENLSHEEMVTKLKNFQDKEMELLSNELGHGDQYNGNDPAVKEAVFTAGEDYISAIIIDEAEGYTLPSVPFRYFSEEQTKDTSFLRSYFIQLKMELLKEHDLVSGDTRGKKKKKSTKKRKRGGDGEEEYYIKDGDGGEKRPQLCVEGAVSDEDDY